MSSNDLTALPTSVFGNLTSLRELNLNNNDLTALPAGVFDKNTALTQLTLVNNNLTVLPAGIFDKNTALTHLNLNNNDLTALPAGVFDKLTGLIHLSLVGNKLTALPAGIFEKLTAVNILELSNNPGSGTFRAVANAGGNQNVQAGAPVTLSGSATGPWGSNVTWSWAQVDASNNDVSPATVTLTGADTATLSFTAPSTSTASVLYFGLTVIGKASSFAYRHIISVAVAAQTSNQEVLDRTSGPSARFENLPGSHDGATPFTVELHFSGEATGIGYEAVRDSVVEASGGTVEKARRLTPGSNQAWELTIQPTQYGDIALYPFAERMRRAERRVHRRPVARERGGGAGAGLAAVHGLVRRGVGRA